MSAWMPDAARVPAYRDGGPMESRAALWIRSDLGSGYSVALTARYANATSRAAHLVIDFRSGEVVQMLPADRRAMWIRSEGIQILVCDTAREGPFPRQGGAVERLKCVESVMGWLHDLHVPDFSPLGPPHSGLPRTAGREAGHYSSEGQYDFSHFIGSAHGGADAA